MDTEGNILIGNSTVISETSSKNIVLGHNPSISDNVHNSIGIGNSIQVNDSNIVYVGNSDTQKIVLNGPIFSKVSSTDIFDETITINDTKYLDYNSIISKLLEKIQKLSVRIDELEKKNIEVKTETQIPVEVKEAANILAEMSETQIPVEVKEAANILAEMSVEPINPPTVEPINPPAVEPINPPTVEPVAVTTFQIPPSSYQMTKKGKKGKKH